MRSIGFIACAVQMFVAIDMCYIYIYVHDSRCVHQVERRVANAKSFSNRYGNIRVNLLIVFAVVQSSDMPLADFSSQVELITK
jgi:hypothetical protein